MCWSAPTQFRPGDIGRLNEVLDGRQARAAAGRPGRSAARRPGPDQVPVQPGRTRWTSRPPCRPPGRASQEACPCCFADPQSSAGTVRPRAGSSYSERQEERARDGLGAGPGRGAGRRRPWDRGCPASGDRAAGQRRAAARVAERRARTPFLLGPAADGMDGWTSAGLRDGPTADPGSIRAGPSAGTHWGHGTFIAGLIRQAAPQAQVLSMRVMDSAGHVDDSAVVNALTWLSRHRRGPARHRADGLRAAGRRPMTRLLADVRRRGAQAD